MSPQDKVKAAKRAWYHKNKDKVKEYNRRWRENHLKGKSTSTRARPTDAVLLLRLAEKNIYERLRSGQLAKLDAAHVLMMQALQTLET